MFAPCALGAVVNDDTIGRLKGPIIAGGANNQLDNMARHGAMLRERKILYAPDYVINAGGLINVYAEINKSPREKALRDAEHIFQTLKSIFATARGDITTAVAANLVAGIASIGKLSSFEARSGQVKIEIDEWASQRSGGPPAASSAVGVCSPFRPTPATHWPVTCTASRPSDSSTTSSSRRRHTR